MSYDAKVYKVFIASPDDVKEEREIVRSVLMRWNAINAETKHIILLPVGWETHSSPVTGITAQEYINDEVLADCDILIGIFWSKVGSPTKNAESGTIEEINRHVSERKLAMLYFSTKDVPYNADLKQIEKVRELKQRYKKDSLYGEFSDCNDLEKKLYNHIELKINEGKFRPTFDSDICAQIKVKKSRPTFDSDILAQINDDYELATEIEKHFPLVSKNLLKIIIDENKSDIVWDAIVNKLAYSSADLRDTLIWLAKRGAFKHKVFIDGYKALAKTNQADFGNFMHALYSINRYEFYDIYNKGFLEDSPFTRRMLELIKEREL